MAEAHLSGTHQRLSEDALQPGHIADLDQFERLSDALADAIIVVDDRGRIVVANRRAERITGYDRGELLGRPVEDLVPAGEQTRHANERSAFLDNPRRRSMLEQMEIFLRRKDGREVSVEIGLIPVEVQGRLHVVSSIWNSTERWKAEEGLIRREAILGAVAFAAERFLRTGSWREHMPVVLERLGTGAQASRVSVFEHHRDEAGRELSSHRFEWTASGTKPQISNDRLQNIPRREIGLDRWAEALGNGGFVCGAVRDFPDEERPILESQGVRSVAITAIFAGGEWWGNLGFADCQREREWTLGELEALRAAADILGAAIRRERDDLTLEASEARLQRITDNAQDLIFRYRLVEPRGFEYVSPAATAITGYTPEEHYADPDLGLRLVHPDDQPLIAELFASLPVRAGAEPPIARAGTLRWIHKDGAVRWIELRNTPVYDGSGQLVAIEGIARDVTDRKRAEEELRDNFELLRRTDDQRRRLLERLVAAQEEERNRIAGDIHDDPVQKLAAAAIRLEMLRKRARDSEEKEMLDLLQGSLDQALLSLRHMLFELRPPRLDTDGLASAMSEYLDRTAQDAGLRFEVRNRLADDPPLETRTIAYRIAQEALVNVRKHGNATRVDVELEERDGGLVVRIVDDGRGFALAEALGTGPGHLGLSSMKERAELAGGQLSVDSSPGAGTTVELWLPLPPRAV